MKKLFLLFVFVFTSVLAFSQTYAQGEKVMVSWKGQWYPGKIEQVKGNDQYLVSYDGYASSWNETVGPDRLKKIGAGNPPQGTATGTAASYSGVETIWDLAASADGKYMYAASAYGMVRILDAADLTEIGEIMTGKEPVQTVSVSPDGKLLAAGTETKLIIYRKDDAGKFTESFSSDAYSSIARIRFSPSGNDLAVGGSPKEDYKKTQLDIWSMSDHSCRNLVKSTNADYVVSGLSWNAAGTKLAVAISNAKHGIDVFDAATAKLDYHIAHTADVVSCAFSPDGQSIAAGGTDKNVTLWSTATHKALWTAPWKSEDMAYVYGVAFSADGKTIAACGSGTGCVVKIYDAATGKAKQELSDLNPGGNAVLFGTGGDCVYVALTTFGDLAKVAVVQKLPLGN